MIEVQEEFEVAADIGRVYATVCNVGDIGYAVAGVQKVDIINENESEWRVLVRAGMIAQTLTLRGMITQRTPPSGLSFRAEGRNVSLTGTIELTSAVGQSTHCRVTAKSEVTGRLASLINLVARTTQKQLIAETIANFRRRLAAHDSSERPEP